MRKIRNDSVAKISCMDNDLQSLNFSWSNCMERRNLTKLRISAHNLAIETGRYTKNHRSDSSGANHFVNKASESPPRIVSLIYLNLSAFKHNEYRSVV